MNPLPPRRGAYGFDAPYAPLLMTLGGVCLLALSAEGLWHGEIDSTRRAIAVFAQGACALWLFLHAGKFVHTTRAGKFAVWADVLDRLGLQGDERLLDIGCGRGAVLLMAAQCLPRGRAVGVDVWSSKDQSGNAEQVTRRNAALEGVAERVELHTADMRQLPFDDGSFDVVVSSLAIARRSLLVRRPVGGDPPRCRDQAVVKTAPPAPPSRRRPAVAIGFGCSQSDAMPTG